jgi:hypothetical protein
MNKIIFPLNQGDSRPEVADLQGALMELVGRGILLAAESDLNRARLLVALRRERAEQSYGDTTNRLVRQFQQEKRLEATGAVDERTANALNALLRELGLLPEEPRPEQPGFEVRGRVSLADGSPAVGLKVVAVDRDLRGEQALGEAQTDRNGGYYIRYFARQFMRPDQRRANLMVRVLDQRTTCWQPRRSSSMRRHRPLWIWSSLKTCCGLPWSSSASTANWRHCWTACGWPS